MKVNSVHSGACRWPPFATHRLVVLAKLNLIELSFDFIENLASFFWNALAWSFKTGQQASLRIPPVEDVTRNAPHSAVDTEYENWNVQRPLVVAKRVQIIQTAC